MHTIKTITYTPNHDLCIVEVDSPDLPAGIDPETKEVVHPYHRILFKPEAIADRKVVYGLDTDIAAIEALVRENVFRYQTETQPHDDTEQAAMGGNNPTIDVAWDQSVAVATTLSPVEPRLTLPEPASEVAQEHIPAGPFQTWIDAVAEDAPDLLPTPEPEVAEEAPEEPTA